MTGTDALLIRDLRDAISKLTLTVTEKNVRIQSLQNQVEAGKTELKLQKEHLHRFFIDSESGHPDM
jgi:hypothetical protein